MARTSPDSEDARVLQPWVAVTSELIQELKPRGDNDDAIRRLAGSRSPSLRMDARLDVVREHYIPAKDEGVIRDSSRSKLEESATSAVR